jgi:hypothetical protein
MAMMEPGVVSVPPTKKVQKYQDPLTRSGETISGIATTRGPKQLVDALKVDEQRKLDYRKALGKLKTVRQSFLRASPGRSMLTSCLSMNRERKHTSTLAP